MGIFKNKFLSIAGQKERLTNVVDVLKQSLNPFSKAKPVANVSNPTLKSALEFVAAKPYSTALAVATGAGAARAVAAAPAKTIGTVASKVAKTVVKYPKTTLAAGVVTGAATTSKTVRNIVFKAGSAALPENVLSTGAVAGKTLEDVKAGKTTPQQAIKQAKTFFTDNSLTTAAVAGGIVAAGAGAVIITDKLTSGKDKISGLVQDKSILDQPIPTIDIPKETPKEPIKTIGPTTDRPITPEVVPITSVKTPGKKRRYRRKTKPKSMRITQKVNINMRQSANKRYINVNNF